MNTSLHTSTCGPAYWSNYHLWYLWKK